MTVTAMVTTDDIINTMWEQKKRELLETLLDVNALYDVRDPEKQREFCPEILAEKWFLKSIHVFQYLLDFEASCTQEPVNMVEGLWHS